MASSSDVNEVHGFEWRQQAECQDVDAQQQQLTKPHYGPPTGTAPSPSTLALTDEGVKMGLAELGNQGLEFSEMEKLSRDYQPDLQVCALAHSHPPLS
jgi:hypothetical protein